MTGGGIIRANMGRAALGLTAAGTIALHMLILPWEGTRTRPYLDSGGVPTVCSGVTGPDVTAAYKAGRVYTADECAALDAAAVARHEKALRAVIDDRVEKSIPDMTMAAFISWTYNVGPSAAARSTLVRRINAGDMVAACNQLPRWTRVNGRIIAGLENRRWRGDENRISEHALCMTGLDPSYATPLAERLYFQYREWVSRIAAADGES